MAGPGTDRRALALDLDGTLLNDGGALDRHVVEGVRRIVDAGVEVYLFSGRMLPSVEPIWRELGLTTPIVSYNGAKIAVPGEAPLYEAGLPAGLTRRVIEHARPRGWQVNIYADDRLVSLTENDILRDYSEHFRVAYTLVDERHAALDTPTKLLVIVDEDEVLATHEDLTATFGDAATYTTSSKRFVEVLPPHTDKGAALRRMAEWRGIPPGRWVAAGDGRNDLEMLETAGVGVAMEPGHPSLRPVADRVLPPLPRGGLEILAQEILGIG